MNKRPPVVLPIGKKTRYGETNGTSAKAPAPKGIKTVTGTSRVKSSPTLDIPVNTDILPRPTITSPVKFDKGTKKSKMTKPGLPKIF